MSKNYDYQEIFDGIYTKKLILDMTYCQVQKIYIGIELKIYGKFIKALQMI